MMNEMNGLPELAAAVRALFVAQRGTWRPEEFVGVANLLGFYAYAQGDTAEASQPLAANYFADLVGTNLAHALTTYAWGDWLPLTDDGVTIVGFWREHGEQEWPTGYVMGETGSYLQHT